MDLTYAGDFPYTPFVSDFVTTIYDKFTTTPLWGVYDKAKNSLRQIYDNP